MLKASKHLLLSYWVPVVLMMVVIAIESTETFSSADTGSMIYPYVNGLWVVVTGHGIAWHLFDQVHMVLRKIGHLTGYGLMWAVWFRAIRETARTENAIESPSWTWFWNSKWARNAMLLTIIVAALDEIHQTMLPSRTGTYVDVIIDTTGAAISLSIAYMLARWSFRKQQARELQPTA